LLDSRDRSFSYRPHAKPSRHNYVVRSGLAGSRTEKLSLFGGLFDLRVGNAGFVVRPLGLGDVVGSSGDVGHPFG
jgi:hypothetical protein